MAAIKARGRIESIEGNVARIVFRAEDGRTTFRLAVPWDRWQALDYDRKGEILGELHFGPAVRQPDGDSHDPDAGG